jgi:hypothetical protein
MSVYSSKNSDALSAPIADSANRIAASQLDSEPRNGMI